MNIFILTLSMQWKTSNSSWFLEHTLFDLWRCNLINKMKVNEKQVKVLDIYKGCHLCIRICWYYCLRHLTDLSRSQLIFWVSHSTFICSFCNVNVLYICPSYAAECYKDAHTGKIATYCVSCWGSTYNVAKWLTREFKNLPKA